MDFIKDIVENVWVQRAVWSIIVILFSLLIYRVTTRVLSKKEKKSSKIINSKKNKTIIRMLKSVVASALAIITVLDLLCKIP